MHILRACFSLLIFNQHPRKCTQASKLSQDVTRILISTTVTHHTLQLTRPTPIQYSFSELWMPEAEQSICIPCVMQTRGYQLAHLKPNKQFWLVPAYHNESHPIAKKKKYIYIHNNNIIMFYIYIYKMNSEESTLSLTHVIQYWFPSCWRLEPCL